MKRFLMFLAVAGVLVGGYFAYRLSPLVTTDNAGADKVVLLHGLGRSEHSMLLLESALTEAGFDVHSFSYPSTEQTPEELIALVSEKIDTCCGEVEETVHFVGHSLGGLLIRAYLANNRPTRLGRAVLLGTPNKGSELADEQPDEPIGNSIIELAGPTAQALRTGPDGFAASLPVPDYPVGVIAGTRDNMVSNEWLPTPNDGMVSVASARLEGMTDFITVDVTHWELRSNLNVTNQVVAFLQQGKFAQGE